MIDTVTLSRFDESLEEMRSRLADIRSRHIEPGKSVRRNSNINSCTSRQVVFRKPKSPCHPGVSQGIVVPARSYRFDAYVPPVRF
jgi:hypothetical protein